LAWRALACSGNRDTRRWRLAQCKPIPLTKERNRRRSTTTCSSAERCPMAQRPRCHIFRKSAHQRRAARRTDCRNEFYSPSPPLRIVIGIAVILSIAKTDAQHRIGGIALRREIGAGPRPIVRARDVEVRRAASILANLGRQAGWSSGDEIARRKRLRRGAAVEQQTNHRRSHLPRAVRAPSGSPGLFFSAPSSAAGTAHPITSFHRFQFPAALRDGIDAQTWDERKAVVATMSEFLGFQANIESLLPLIQGADQEIHLLMQHLGRIGSASSARGTLAVGHRLLSHRCSPPLGLLYSVPVPSAM